MRGAGGLSPLAGEMAAKQPEGVGGGSARRDETSSTAEVTPPRSATRTDPPRKGEGKTRLHLFDTTLRDGQQTPGIDFSVEDKIAIAKMLDAFGIDYVEGGYPGANPTDTAFFAEKRTARAKFVAFGMTKRVGISASNDPGLAALLQAKSDAVCFVAKSWDYHVRVALQTSEAENLESISQSVSAAREAGREVLEACSCSSPMPATCNA